MKFQATVVLTLQARTLEGAGAALDAILERAHERDDVTVGRVEIVTPPGEGVVTLPPMRTAPTADTRPSS